MSLQGKEDYRDFEIREVETSRGGRFWELFTATDGDGNRQRVAAFTSVHAARDKADRLIARDGRGVRPER